MSRTAAVPAGPFAPPVPRHELPVQSADGTRLYAEVHGPQGAPTVVLSHGWTLSTAFWAPVVRDLSADWRVVVYDQRGHGRSAAPGPGGYSTDALADDLSAVLGAALAPGERAVLAGHSMGGMTIIAAAHRADVRERTAAVLLASTGSSRLVEQAKVFAFRRLPRLRDWLHRFMLISRAPLGPVTPVTRAALKYGTMGPASARERVAVCARIVHACPRGVRAKWGHVLAELAIDANVPRLSAPTAVVVGTADRLTPPLHARGLQARLPDCVSFTELPGLGHMTPIEAPGRIAGVIRRLVADHLADGAGAERPAAAAAPAEQAEQAESAEPAAVVPEPPLPLEESA